MASSREQQLRVALVALDSAVVLACAASPASAIKLPKGWSHAQVNVVIKHRAHTLIYDRGVITRVAPGALTLKESDSSVVLIPIAPDGSRHLWRQADGRLQLSSPRRVRADGARRRSAGETGQSPPGHCRGLTAFSQKLYRSRRKLMAARASLYVCDRRIP